MTDQTKMSFKDRILEFIDSVGKPILSLVLGFLLMIITVITISSIGGTDKQALWSLVPLAGGVILGAYFYLQDKKKPNISEEASSEPEFITTTQIADLDPRADSNSKKKAPYRKVDSFTGDREIVERIPAEFKAIKLIKHENKPKNKVSRTKRKPAAKKPTTKKAATKKK